MQRELVSEQPYVGCLTPVRRLRIYEALAEVDGSPGNGVYVGAYCIAKLILF
jgi:hypothetical protein